MAVRARVGCRYAWIIHVWIIVRRSAVFPRPPPMQAYVYKSLRKDGAYVFLAEREDFERIPEPVRLPLEPFKLVLEVDLTPPRELARGNAAEVRENLALRGFHVQLPPPTSIDPLTQDWGTDA